MDPARNPSEYHESIQQIRQSPFAFSIVPERPIRDTQLHCRSRPCGRGERETRPDGPRRTG